MIASPVVALVLSLKFLLPISFLWFPFQASWLNFVLDSVDGDILMHSGMDPVSYQTWDKAADYVTYIMMLIVGMRWRIRKTIVFLFCYRTIGQVLFFTTRNDAFFFWFPNFLEPLFMMYSLLLFSQKGKEDRAFGMYKKYLVPIWLMIIGFKMWNEYNIHVAHNDLSEQFFGFNN